MKPQTSLRGLRVLVTRPADQAELLCRLLETHGAAVVRLPMQAIEPVRQDAAARALQQARDAWVWIFTSANAVRHARHLDAGVWPRAIAVGPATAAVLEQIGVDVVVPQQHDSEGVLALPELQDVRDRRIALITGEGGRGQIEAGLDARGARVERIEVYRRVALPHAAETLAQAVAGVDAAIVTNGEALQQLVRRVPDAARDALLRVQLVVPSRRVVELAREMGFTAPPLIPEQIADAGYLHCLERWWDGARRDSRMTEHQDDQPAAAAQNDEPARAPAVAPRRAGGAWLVLALLVLAVLAAGAWQAWRAGSAWIAERDERIADLAQSLKAAEAQIDRLQTRLSDQAVAVQRAAAELARIPDRLQAQDQAIGELREELGGGRARVQLALVEQLLLLANDRVQVAREVTPAIAALDAADARLAALKDPRLFELRETIARERAALQAVAQPDTVGAALVLSGLVARAAQLPLATQVPEHFHAQPGAALPLPADAGAWARAWAAIKRALASAFSVRRADGPQPRLLGDEQTALVRQVLMLKLEGARVALLRQDSASFRDLCASAAGWLDQYFHAGDPAVAAARAELLRLQGMQLQPPLPDISRSLTLLRARLEATPQ
ncbi:uroporphyrinogen-III C-methyltransferase [Fontimonas sp. SYSU GA230001]|uniref:uroporphyrinogen-III C-methyltransferase n=1 Tax=Fontimonas sp. SYSU GA230001 TaxID=3142450 RepID=UPI0032B611B2